MFASLIIVLPSKFEDGEVYVSHGNDKDVFDVSPSSEFTTSALAWYTDVTHEVKSVTSGYRLAVSYNLVNNAPGLPPPHLPDIHSAIPAVEGVFRKWRKGDYDNPNFSGTLACLLDHEYSEAGLEFAGLEGKDSILISNIRGVAEKQGICLRLGLLECAVSGHGKYKIQGLYDLEGDLAKGGAVISLDPKFDMIPQDPSFDGKDPDDQMFESYRVNVSSRSHPHCAWD